MSNPTITSNQFNTYPVDTSTGATYFTFNYGYIGELSSAVLKLKNPSLNATQFTLNPIDTSTAGIFNTFNYNYPGELSSTQLVLKNPTLTNSEWKPAAVSADNITSQFKNTNPDNADETIKQTILWNSTTDNEQLVNNQVQPSLSDISNRAGLLAASLGGSYLGIPQVSQVASGLIPNTSRYSTLAFNQLKNVPGVKYADFRSRKIYDAKGVLQDIPSIRADAASAAVRGETVSPMSLMYAGASASPFGAYSIFNLDGTGTTGYGWGDHDNPTAIRNDFTLRSHVATRWADGKWKPVIGLESAVPFRGDRVTVIDFGQRDLKNAYRWRNSNINLGNVLGSQINNTQDFIKFYFTGPAITNNNSIEDDIIVFRATITSLTDTYSPSWTPQTMIGRADPNYHYTGVTRDLNLDFTVYATDRDEVKPIWRKLNALAGYTAPEYDSSTIAFKAPWMRITIGDLFHQQAVFITSLAYTLHDNDTTWEINIERDPTMKQVPHKISVSIGLTLVSDFLPQKRGKFYSLAKSYDADGMPIDGPDNWLSDFEKNPTALPLDERYLPPIETTKTADSISTESTLSTKQRLQSKANATKPYKFPEVKIGQQSNTNTIIRR